MKSIINIDYLKITFKVNNFETKKTDFFGKEVTQYENYNSINTINKSFVDGKYIITNDFYFTECNNPELKSKTEDVFLTCYLENKLIGYYYFEGVNKDLVFFRFDNNVFYSNQNISLIIKKLESILHLTYYGINGIDVCCNTDFNIYSPLSIIFDQCFNNPYFQNINKVNKSDLETFGGRTEKDVKFKSIISKLTMYQIDSTIYFGNKKNGKRLKVYNKSEFSTPIQKKYLKKNFQTDQPIYRIELSLRNKGNVKINEIIDISQINDFNQVLNVFKDQVESMLTFKDLRSYTYDLNRNKVHPTINLFQDLNLTTPTPIKINVVEKVKLSNRIQNPNKRYFKNLVTDYLKGGNTTFEEIKDWIETKPLVRNGSIEKTDFVGFENIPISLKIIRSMIGKDVVVYDYSILNKLINEIEEIEYRY